MGPSHHIMREKLLKSPNSNNRFQHVAKIYKESSNFLLSSWACSQIWLSPLVDNGPTHLPHKFEMKNTDTDRN